MIPSWINTRLLLILFWLVTGVLFAFVTNNSHWYYAALYWLALVQAKMGADPSVQVWFSSSNDDFTAWNVLNSPNFHSNALEAQSTLSLLLFWLLALAAILALHGFLVFSSNYWKKIENFLLYKIRITTDNIDKHNRKTENWLNRNSMIQSETNVHLARQQAYVVGLNRRLKDFEQRLEICGSLVCSLEQSIKESTHDTHPNSSRSFIPLFSGSSSKQENDKC